jgi:hypothetical protein
MSDYTKRLDELIRSNACEYFAEAVEAVAIGNTLQAEVKRLNQVIAQAEVDLRNWLSHPEYGKGLIELVARRLRHEVKEVCDE